LNSGQAPAVPAAGDDSEWPDENDESQFLSGAAGRGETPAPGAGRTAEAPIVGERLPPLEELVAKVPEGLRGILDDLFRAKFTGVRRFTAAAGTDQPK
jgi:hypothetical protein